MLLIPCPHCGPRAQIEFTYGGDATVQRPPLDASVSQAQWLDYVYLRDNPCGDHLEWWQHSSGCRAWIRVRRNTRNHLISGAWTATEDVPPLDPQAPAP